MKFEWTWIVSILFAIIIAVFSVMNVDSVLVNYVFGVAEWPLVLVILGSALLGAAVSGFIALFRAYSSRHKVKELTKEIKAKESLIAAQQNEIADLKKQVPKIIKHEEKKRKITMNDPVIEVEDVKKQ